MKKINLEESLLISEEDVRTSFDKFKKIGLIFTPHDEWESISEPPIQDLRLIGARPSGLASDQISFGPFPVELSYYYEMKELIYESEEMCEGVVLLAILKIQYELTGKAEKHISLEFDGVLEESKTFLRVCDLVNLYEIFNPHITEYYAWFFPSDRLGKEIAGDKSKYNYLCWIFAEKFDEQFSFTVDESGYALIPLQLADKWAQYLPGQSHTLIMELCQARTRGDEFIEFESEEECLRCIKDILKPIAELEINPDRELLINELYSLNRLKYPNSYFDHYILLKNIGFIKMHESKCILDGDLKDPEDLLRKIPKEWKRKADLYKITGSALIGYLKGDEFRELI
ncbi:hypothetical protein [Leptospira santarosai]|uniref:hypothetical protein n=1 Tax=Leptospira santarosai TaxID=28183 RepID=UPI00095B184A|nr:hypothetical protein [Leptospira santarosai]OLY65326.1 hypothetical protein BWD11_04400 [Leptospira santarosai serovar Grippotyphosa]ONF75748.1 hypothetical protein BWD12_20210 [Leptospira santarosai serovar Bananal]